jgi:CDGSH-type Zn-finger protein
MAREVTHTERGPHRLTPDDIDEKYGDVAICQCGLSADRPFCDGSHRRTEDEDEGVLYRYVDGERQVVGVVSDGNHDTDDGTVDGGTTGATDENESDR